jgi:hypothetical protein
VVAWVAVGATVGGDCRVFCDLNHAIGLSVSAGGGVLCEVAVQSGAGGACTVLSDVWWAVHGGCAKCWPCEVEAVRGAKGD